MSDADNYRAFDPARLELIEANVDMAFSLVDDPRTQCREGNAEFAHAVLEDANQVVRNIEDRLWKFDAPHSAPSGALGGKLRKEIDAAQVECA